MYTLLELESKTFGELRKIGDELNVLPKGDRRYRQSWIDAIAGVNPPLLQLLEVSPAEVQAQESPIIETVEASPAADDVQAQERPIESKFGRIVSPRPAQVLLEQAAKNPPGVKVDRVSEAIVLVAENFPDNDAPKCSEYFDDGFIEDEFGCVKICQCNEPKLSHQKTHSAIVPTTKISKSDQNSILTGIVLSDRFLARYAPPQAETLHHEITDGYKVDTDGQLSFLEAQVVSEPEPPDPDDFESLDAFRKAIARWDLEHPTSSFDHPTSSFDHCSDILPRSVHSEPPDPDDFDSMFAFWAAYDAWDEASDDDFEPLEISLDSFCEWAPCPADWYEPVALNGSSKVLELSPARKTSITSDFFIPTFGGLGDRNRSDEPPDTGIFARLPKPKPPTFPPQASQPKSAQVSPSQASRNYPETIPKLFHRVVAGSILPARSPPGGDAMS
jgi:hypothetical protein